jgi:hypothetical protein
MQRSFSYQNVINRLLLVGLYVIYISLSSIYLLLPPMLAVLFYAYHDALSKHDLFRLLIASAMLLIFEAEKGFWFGSTIIFFTLLSRYLLPRFELVLQCRICMAAIFSVLGYLGYWIFMLLANGILLLHPPMIDWHSGLYMIIEFLILSVVI